MTKTTIHFQDLKEPAQGKIWQAVQDELLARAALNPNSRMKMKRRSMIACRKR